LSSRCEWHFDFFRIQLLQITVIFTLILEHLLKIQEQKR